MRPNEVTFNNLPEAIAQILQDNIAMKERISTLSEIVERLSPEDEVMDIKQAAKFLSKSERALYTLCFRKSIPHHKPNKNLQFFRSELIEWIRSGKNIGGAGTSSIKNTEVIKRR